MQGKKLIQSLHLSNFLTFGRSFRKIDLQPLNVLIGPNGSGKSNFIEALRILSATPEDLEKPIREGGGTSEYLWKGVQAPSLFGLGATISWETAGYPIRHSIGVASDRFYVRFETIEAIPLNGEESSPLIFYTYNHGDIAILRSKKILPASDNFGSLGSQLISDKMLLMGDLSNTTGGSWPLEFPETHNFPLEKIEYTGSHISVDITRSILSQYKDPIALPAFSHLQKIYSGISFYTGWNLGRFGTLRYPQKADLPSTTLLEDGSNLGLVLISKPAIVRQEITERLKIVLPTVEEIFPKIEGGTVPLYIREKGFSTPTPASRLSEGTLRYLCLLTLLLDPEPPPIICLEEPEIGLHPHVVSQIAELLIDASQRTQLIVTTHSDALISGLSECPEAIITCERDDEGTKLRRLDPEQIKPWLDRYALGDLWRMGEIGGVR